ncbi:MAG: hypothetical protein J6J77_06060 [Alistipes sp.]|nr:hypothetical protein [Alistipes sp.]
MSDSKIICPSCGAENKYGGKCEFCGATLDSGDSTTVYNSLLEDAQDSEDILFRTTIDKFENTTTITLRDRPSHNNVKLRANYCGIDYGEMKLFYLIFECIRYADGKDEFHIKNIDAFLIDGVVYKLDNKAINCDVLKSLCDGQSIIFRKSSSTNDKYDGNDGLRHCARLIYNKVIDSSAYQEDVQAEIELRKHIYEYIRKEEEVRRIEEEACEVRVARYAKIVYWFLYICRFIYNKVLIVVLVVLILVLILSAIYNNFFS